jgi:hypothetical protein
MKEFGKETTDYLNIKNPFICKSVSEVRVSSKHPDKYINENNNHVIKGESGNTYLYNPTDEKLCFTFGKNDEDTKLIDIDKFDYEVPAEILNEKRTDGKTLHKDGLPLSFIQIDNEVDGVEWYKKHYPKIPDDLLSIISRYHWGEPITKKAIKNEKKKIEKKAQAQGLKIMTKKDNEDNPFVVKFD